MVKRDETGFSVSSALSGYLGALFGAEFSLYLFSHGREREKSKAPKISITPLHKKIINILQVIELEFDAARFENVRKYCFLFIKILYELQPENSLFLRTFPQAIIYRLFIGMGDYLAGQGHLHEALAFYRHLLKEHPDDNILLKKAAGVFFMMGPAFLPESESLYRQALKNDPGDLDLYERLGRILEYSPDRESEAGFLYRDALRHCGTDMEKIRFYLLLLKLEPHDPKILSRLGRLYLRGGMYLEAKNYMERGGWLSRDAWAALDLSYLYALLNETNNAEQLLRNLDYYQEGGEAYYPGLYLLGLIRETEEKWEEAALCYGGIKPSTPLFWKARAGMARIFLSKGDYSSAEGFMRHAPEKERKALRSEFPDLYDFLVKSLESRLPSAGPGRAAYNNLFLQANPEYALLRDIRKRSMGAGFWRKYEVLDVLGRGPFGQVLLGRERAGGLKVAIKQLDTEIAADPVILRRCQQTLKTVRSFSHPGIITVYESCYYNGCFYYAMEYLEWGNLEGYIRLRAPLTLAETAEIALKICKALDYLYRQKGGITHGALKPENILFCEDGGLKLTDFDFLWAASEGGRKLPPGLLKKRARLAIASIYVAPERFFAYGFPGGRQGFYGKPGALQADLLGADHRSDLYSLGIILFEMLTAHLPFRKRSGRAAAAFHRSRKISSPKLYHPALPAEFEQIILKLMQKNPDNRFNSPAEVAVAIKNAKI